MQLGIAQHQRRLSKSVSGWWRSLLVGHSLCPDVGRTFRDSVSGFWSGLRPRLTCLLSGLCPRLYRRFQGSCPDLVVDVKVSGGAHEHCGFLTCVSGTHSMVGLRDFWGSCTLLV